MDAVDRPTLLDPLTEPQQRLIEIVAEVFLEYHRWPTFDYVARKMDSERVGDAELVIASLRRTGPAGGTYAAVWRPGSALNDPIGLTVLGIHHSAVMSRLSPPLEDGFFAVLHHFVQRRLADQPSPFEVSEVIVESEHAVAALERAGIRSARLPPTELYQLLEHEPATWYGGRGGGDGDAWRWQVTRHVLNFEAVSDVREYVSRILATTEEVPSRRRAVASPLDLPAALDYLDAIWRLVPGHKASLVQLHGTERTTKLGYPAEIPDELDARLSALGEILTTLRVPDVKPGGGRKGRGGDAPLKGLRAYLLQRADSPAHARLNGEVDKLEDVVGLRHGAHHGSPATRSKAATAYQRLGIAYPPIDARATWEAVQARTIEALEGIREELNALVPEE